MDIIEIQETDKHQPRIQYQKKKTYIENTKLDAYDLFKGAQV